MESKDWLLELSAAAGVSGLEGSLNAAERGCYCFTHRNASFLYPLGYQLY